MCKTIHFNWLNNYGTGKGNHSARPDKKTLKKLLLLYKTYMPNSNLVLEINEPDLLDANEFGQMASDIKKLENINYFRTNVCVICLHFLKKRI